MWTTRRETALLLATFVLAMASNTPHEAVAQESENWIVPDRPGFYWGAPTVPRGKVQLEMGYLFARIDELETNSFGQFLFRIGTSARTEIRIGVNSYTHLATAADDTRGVEDSSLGVKIRLLDGNPGTGFDRPALSFQATAVLPTGSEGLRREEVQPDVLLISAWNLASTVSTVFNLGYTSVSEEGGRRGFWYGSWAMEKTFGRKTSGFIELYGLVPADDSEGNQAYSDIAFAWRVVPKLQLDAHFGYGLNGRDKDFFLGIGATFGF